MIEHTSTERQTFRALVADVAARAKARLPEAVNGRVESAVKLVLGGDVLFLDDGTVEVGSSSDPLKTYTVAGRVCDCQDYAYGRAPEGWCQHRLAVAIQQRVQEQLTAQAPTPPPVELPEDLEPWPDNDILEVVEPATAPAAAALQPLPEAPASVNVRVTISGRECQITLRDTDEARLLARLEAVLQRFPVAAPPPAPAPKGASWCALHQWEMKWNEGREGKRGWYSHRTDEGWCKGK